MVHSGETQESARRRNSSPRLWPQRASWGCLLACPTRGCLFRSDCWWAWKDERLRSGVMSEWDGAVSCWLARDSGWLPSPSARVSVSGLVGNVGEVSGWAVLVGELWGVFCRLLSCSFRPTSSMRSRRLVTRATARYRLSSSSLPWNTLYRVFVKPINCTWNTVDTVSLIKLNCIYMA